MFTRLFSICLLLVTFAGPAIAESPDEMWTAALNAFTNGDAARAHHLFVDWIASQERQGIFSSEAHHNLALVCWAEKDPGCTTYQLLESAILSHSPPFIWLAAHQVTEIENQVGMKEGISDDLAFRSYLLVNRNLVIWLGAFAGWLFLAAVQAWTTRRRRFLGVPAPALVTLAILLGIFSTSGWINFRYFSHYGVLAGKAGGVPIYKEPGETPDKRLADLPNGTVIRIAEQKDQAVRISAPVTGWVASDQVLPL
jgi:hypothetical protein